MARGWSYTELLVTMAVAAVLLNSALPSMLPIVREQRGERALQNIFATVQFARGLAITMRATVTFCPGNGDRCGRRDSWHRGGLVFLDHNGNGDRDRDEEVIKRLPATSHGRIRWRSFRSRSYLQFTYTGFTNWQNGHFQYCPFNGDARGARQLILNAPGRARIAPDTDGDGIHEDARGRPLAC